MMQMSNIDMLLLRLFTHMELLGSHLWHKVDETQMKNRLQLNQIPDTVLIISLGEQGDRNSNLHKVP